MLEGDVDVLEVVLSLDPLELTATPEPENMNKRITELNSAILALNMHYRSMKVLCTLFPDSRRVKK